MERDFYRDEFEELIRQKADQYKLYPSDHVWKGVYRALHGRRKWYWAGMAIALLGISLSTANYFFLRKNVDELTNNMQSNLNALQSTDASIPSNQQSTAEILNSDPSSSTGNGLSIAGPAPDFRPGGSFTDQDSDAGLFSNNKLEISSPIINSIAEPRSSTELRFDRSPEVTTFISAAIKPDAEQKKIAGQSAAVRLADASSESSDIAQQENGGINWLQEQAVYQMEPAKVKRVGWMLYFSPTINYRKLTGNSSGYYPASDKQSVPLALSFKGEVEQYVNHRPAIGFELGTNFQYRNSKHVNFKAGIQFNYSRYNIEAFEGQPELATIALSPYWNTDTLTSYTNVRNMSGSSQQEIANQYFQISVPIGLEVRVLGNEKIQFNIAGTIQPTFLLNRNSYLITTDYKNYTKEPSLVRPWNVNAGIETYIAYNTGTVRWQLGPQFRYQLFSSYVKEYPIREYLMEYGFKIGVSKLIR